MVASYSCERKIVEMKNCGHLYAYKVQTVVVIRLNCGGDRSQEKMSRDYHTVSVIVLHNNRLSKRYSTLITGVTVNPQKTTTLILLYLSSANVREMIKTQCFGDGGCLVTFEDEAVTSSQRERLMDDIHKVRFITHIV